MCESGFFFKTSSNAIKIAFSLSSLIASLQYSSASWVAQYREFRPLTIVQPGNNGRHSINLVTKHPNSILKFSQISYDIKYNSKGNEWRVCCSDDGSCGIVPQWSTPSVSDLVQELYTALNVKNTHRLDQLLSVGKNGSNKHNKMKLS
ncbi:hypothetical protein V6Z11_D02G086300 [Gossypium hirsutum]